MAIERLLDHHRAWLMQQPEWSIVLGSTDRATRRRVAKALADEFTTIPAYEGGDKMNRALRRRVFAELERRDPEFYKGLEST